MMDHRCNRKRAFKTQASAEHAAKMLRRKALDPSRVRAYPCQVHVGKWHVGNLPYSPTALSVLRGERP